MKIRDKLIPKMILFRFHPKTSNAIMLPCWGVDFKHFPCWGVEIKHLTNLNGGGVAYEGARHCETLNHYWLVFFVTRTIGILSHSNQNQAYFHLWRDVTDGSFDIVRNPLDEEGGVLGLHVQHLLVNLEDTHIY